ncbi:MAG: hypothetical protein AAB632_02745 [Patescibacteria group bacterium]
MKKVIKALSTIGIIIFIVATITIVIGGLIRYSSGETVTEEKMLAGGILVQKVSENLTYDAIRISLTDQACPKDQETMYVIQFGSSSADYLSCNSSKPLNKRAGYYEDKDITIRKFSKDSEDTYRHHELSWGENI